MNVSDAGNWATIVIGIVAIGGIIWNSGRNSQRIRSLEQINADERLRALEQSRVDSDNRHDIAEKANTELERRQNATRDYLWSLAERRTLERGFARPKPPSD